LAQGGSNWFPYPWTLLISMIRLPITVCFVFISVIFGFRPEEHFNQNAEESDFPTSIELVMVPTVEPSTELFSPLYGEWWSRYLEVSQSFGLALTSHLLRFKQFKANYQRIVKVNSRNRTYRVGLGPFTHLSKADFSNYGDFCHHGFDRKKGEKEESQFFSGWSSPAGTTMPDSIDWEVLGKVTPPKSQAKCGSCWAFATAAAIESRRAIATGILQNFSEKELIDCVVQKDGSLIERGFEHVIQSGLHATEEYTGTCSSAGPKPLLKGFMRSFVEDEEALRFALSSGPVAVGIQADQWDMQHYYDGIISGSFCNTALNHAALLVGYGADEKLPYWRLKNSWGKIWGEGGYFRLIRNSDRNDEYGQCGITLRASFPVV